MMKTNMHNSALIGALIFSLSLPTVLSSCDTTEEGYHVGTPDDVIFYTSSNEFGTDTLTRLPLTADGAAQEFYLISNVDWKIQDFEENSFKLTYNKNIGSTRIQVTANPNTTEKAKNAEVFFDAPQFNKSTKIELSEAFVEFSMEAHEYDEAPEQGASYTLSFKSTIAWKFNITGNEDNWAVFNPGTSGEGQWGTINITVSCAPNYTPQPRTVKIVLAPVDSEFEQYVHEPAPISLTQAAGTLPTDVTVALQGEPDSNGIPLTISYKSTAPVEDVGVILSETGASYSVPLSEGTSYPLSGSFDLMFQDLSTDTHYSLVPYVVSKVGETRGEPLEIGYRIPEIDDNKPIN